MVLYRVIRATVQVTGDLGPLVLARLIEKEQDELLFLAPICLLYPGVQMVMPALAALFADPTRQLAGYFSPLDYLGLLLEGKR